MTTVETTLPHPSAGVRHPERTATHTFTGTKRAADSAAELLTSKDAVAESGMSLVTLNRNITSGTLPSKKLKGKNHITRGDLQAATGQAPIAQKNSTAADDSLRALAERIAASAPPLRPEQQDVIIAAFAGALAQN